MNIELISIIVPVYKVEEYLNECIESILKQTYTNLEIILVDDGSPDNCGEICNEYARKDKRIKVIHKENGGLSSARNTGLDIAKGEYVSFIDSDDCISEKFVERLYEICKKEGADIAECDFTRFNKKEDININNSTQIELYSSIEMQEKIYTNEVMKTIIVCNKLYKKYIYETLRFPIGKINEDEFTTYKAFDNCKRQIAVTSEKLYYYRLNDNSIMRSKYNIKRLDILDAYKERKEYYKEKKYTNLYEKTVIKYQEALIDYYILTKQYIDKSDSYLKSILNDFKENYSDYKAIKKVGAKTKLKIRFFMTFPDFYSWSINLKRKVGIKV